MGTIASLCGMCAVRCPIRVTVEDGTITWIEGNSLDPAMGTALCARGGAGLALLSDDERPQTPLIRTGPRGSGQWRAVSWDEALDFVAAKLTNVKTRLGARAIALSDRSGPFTDLTKAFIQAIGSPNYFDYDASCGRNAHHAALALFGRGRTGLVHDLRHCRHLVLYGRNLVESLQVKEVRDFMANRAEGGRCTTIDPRVSLTAARSDRYWQIRPNADYALNLALINEVLASGLYDKAFAARWTIGLDSLAEQVRPFTPEWQEPHTGIPAAELRALVREVAAAAPAVIFHPGWMTARHRQSYYVSRTAYILNVLTGAIEVRGGTLLAKNAKDAGWKPLNRLTGCTKKVEEPRVDGAGTCDPPIDPASGLLHRLFGAMASGTPYPIGAYIAYRHDPLTAMPDPERVKAALDKLDLLVAIDVNYSETAWYADVILPEAAYLERANLIGATEGPRPALILRDQAVPPRLDGQPAWWIFRELAKRLGAGEAFAYDGIEDLWRWQLQDTGVDLDRLRQDGIVFLADKPIIWDRDEGLKFPTPSGKIDLGAPLPPFTEQPALEPDAFRLLFGRTALLSHGQSTNNPLLADMVAGNPVWIHPVRAQALGIADGQAVTLSNGGAEAHGTAFVTPLIHPEAAFLLHGFGRTVPRQTRAFGKGIADQRLQTGQLHVTDPMGGGNALTETVIRIRRS